MIGILRKELLTYLGTPWMYLFTAVFLAVSGYLFYSNLVMAVLLQDTSVAVDLWEYTCNDIRFLLMAVLPFVSMRLLAEERKLGTLELLLTAPLHDRAIVWGKFLAALTVCAGMLAATLLYGLLYRIFCAPVAPGPLLAGYLGLALLGTACLSCGMFFSALTHSQITAAVASLGTLQALWFADRAPLPGSTGFSGAQVRLSLHAHCYNFNRGVVDTADIVYYGCLIALFLGGTFLGLRLSRGSLRNARHSLRADIPVLKIVVFLALLTTAVITGQRFHLRCDLTPGRLYSLSPQTEAVLRTLAHRLRITVYCAGESRLQYEELLECMAATCPRVEYCLLDFDQNRARAERDGVTAAGSGSARYRARTEIVAQVNEVSLVQAIRVLTAETGKTVLMRLPQGAPCAGVLAVLTTLGFDITHQPGRGASHPALHIITAGGTAGDLSPEKAAAADTAFRDGQSVLLLLDPGPVPRVGELLKKYNLLAGPDLIFDPARSGDTTDTIAPLIFFSREHPATAPLTMPGLFPPTRSIQVGRDPDPALQWTILGFSGRGTWAETDREGARAGTASFESGRDLYGPVPAAVLVQPRDRARGALVVVGCAAWITDAHLEALGNRSFFTHLVQWLHARQTRAAALPEPVVRDASPARPLRITERTGRWIFWSVVVAQPLLFVLIGCAVALRRHRAG